VSAGDSEAVVGIARLRPGHDPRNAEVNDLHLAFEVMMIVAGFQVTVNDVVAMGKLQRGRDGCDDPLRLSAACP